MRTIYALILVIIILSLPCFASQTLPVELTNSSNTFNAIEQIEYFKDPERQLTVDQISSPVFHTQFTANKQPNLNFGRSHSAHWLRFQVINYSQQKWYLLLDAMLGDELDLYIFPAASTNNEVGSYAKKLKDYRRSAWSLDLPKGELLQVYLRVTNGDSIINVPIQFLSTDQMLSYSNEQYKLYSAIYGGTLIIGLYQLFMFASVRERSYLFLSLATFFSMAATHRINPIFDTLSFLNDTNQYFFTLPSVLALTAAFAFIRELLETKKYAPLIDSLFRKVIQFSFILIVIAGSIPFGVKYVLFLGLPSVMLIQFSAFYIAYFKGGGIIAKYIAWIYLFPFFSYAAMYIGISFNSGSWTTQQDIYLSLSGLLFALLLSLVQAHKVRLQNDDLQRTQAANNAKDEFIAVMNHELRTPMNAIVGLSSLIKLEQLTKTQQTYANRLDSATKHMMQLINNILDFSKTNQPHFSLERKPFQLSVTLQSVYHLLLQQAQQKDLQFNLDNTLDEKLVLSGDRARLTQVLNNLLTNAIRYTPEGSITLSVLPSSSNSHDTIKLKFSVKDTGLGIADDQIEEILTPYTQLKIENKAPQREGLGLGLPISKNLIEQMGSTLHVDSQPNKGSEFYFELELPIASENEIIREGNAELTRLRLPAGSRLLLVDDSELNRFVGMEILQNMGAEVMLANGGKNAIVQLQKYNYDLVLLDISMPEVSGLDVACWIRQQSNNPHIPVIAMTAHNLESTRQQCEAAGMNDFVLKPYEYQELYQTLSKHLSLADPVIIPPP
jgi:signal transduction histidine kinase/ActR/RegA family two-component response regulator